MKKFLVSIAIFFLFSAQTFSHVGHYAKYNYLEYELFRNNRSIGLYKYFAKSEENYEKGVFKSYMSKTKQNKKDRYVDINLDPKNEHLNINGSSFKGKANKDFIVGTWWNHEIIKKKAQISGISGRIIKQTVTFIGKEDVKIGNKIYKTLRFNFKSSDKTLPESKKLNTDIWYEEKTYLWVKAAFDKNGYWEYRLKNYN